MTCRATLPERRDGGALDDGLVAGDERRPHDARRRHEEVMDRVAVEGRRQGLPVNPFFPL
jgi:hypothetical protein